MINSGKRMNAGHFCTLLWQLEGNLLTLLILSTRSTLQGFDLGTQNKMGISPHCSMRCRGWCLSCHRLKGDLTALYWLFLFEDVVKPLLNNNHSCMTSLAHI